MRHSIRWITIAGALYLAACSGEAPEAQEPSETPAKQEPAEPGEAEAAASDAAADAAGASDETEAAGADATPEPSATPAASAAVGGDDAARAEAYVAASCACLFDNYGAAGQANPALKICIDQASAAHAIPTDVTETFTVQVGPTKVTHPRLFESDAGNQAYAKAQQACTLRFSTALQKYQTQTWTDAICMKQCADEGEAKKLCTKVCMDARLPSAEPDAATGTATSAPAACEDKCASLEGRSKYACERTCKTEGAAADEPAACEDKCASLEGRSKYACERKCKTE